MTTYNRREFIRTSSAAVLSGAVAASFGGPCFSQDALGEAQIAMRLGLVTYNWGKDWDLPTVIANCSATRFEGVELRSTHKHGVEITLDQAARKEVAKRFADSDVELVGLGSACDYHSPDPAELKANIEETKAFVRLCHDLGGGGVKVRPNGLPEEVPVAKTLEQIGRALHEVAEFGADHGVAIRVEVHGRGTSELPHMKTIMDHADHENAYVCWNCNAQDLQGDGLEHNFRLVAEKINTVHIHDLRGDQYPWNLLFSLLKGQKFSGWTLLEDGAVLENIVAAMHENRKLWEQLAG